MYHDRFLNPYPTARGLSQPWTLGVQVACFSSCKIQGFFRSMLGLKNRSVVESSELANTYVPTRVTFSERVGRFSPHSQNGNSKSSDLFPHCQHSSANQFNLLLQIR